MIFQKTIPLILLGILYVVSDAYSLNRIWTNTQNDQRWDEPLNWIPIGVPLPADSVSTGYADDIVIPTGHVASIKYFKHLGNLVIEAGAELIITDGHFNCNGDVLNQGVITISNSPTYGLKHSSQQANSRPIDNEGSIFIHNSALAGLWIRDDQTFTNKVGGIVEITDSGEASVELLGIFSNIGIFRAQGSAIETAILMEDEESNFINLTCAKTIIRDKITINNGLFSNFGFLRQNYDGVNTTTSSPFHSYVVNYGLIEDITGSFANFVIVNLGSVISVYEERVLEGEPTSIFKSESPPDNFISDVYLEKQLTTLAGTYDYMNKSWIPNSNAVGKSSFYVEVAHDEGSCLDTVNFNLGSPVASVNYWKGGTGSWEFGVNWNFGTVPAAGEIVAIYNKSDKVTIPLSYDAFANELILRGILIIAPLASLSIDNLSVDRGIDVAEGCLFNNGRIDLHSTTRGIYLAGGSLENNGEINCSGSSFCVEMVSEEGVKSNLVNTVNGSVSADSARIIYALNSVVTNYGLLDSQIDGISSAISGDSLYNYGTINIKGPNKDEGKGMLIDYINAPSGVINVSRMEEGFSSTGRNFGTITVDSCELGFNVSGGDFYNEDEGKLIISDCENGIDLSLRDFYNNPGGRVMLNKNELGILIPSAGFFFNKGLMEIDSSSDLGIHCYGKLYNELAARITMDRGGGNGVLLDASTANIYCRDQSILEINKFNGRALLLERGKLWLEDEAVVRVRSK